MIKFILDKENLATFIYLLLLNDRETR